jgi:hypothetical protein
MIPAIKEVLPYPGYKREDRGFQRDSKYPGKIRKKSPNPGSFQGILDKNDLCQRKNNGIR